MSLSSVLSQEKMTLMIEFISKEKYDVGGFLFLFLGFSLVILVFSDAFIPIFFFISLVCNFTLNPNLLSIQCLNFFDPCFLFLLLPLELVLSNSQAGIPLSDYWWVVQNSYARLYPSVNILCLNILYILPTACWVFHLKDLYCYSLLIVPYIKSFS